MDKWYVREGDRLDFGDPICALSLSEWMALRKTKRAVNLVKITERGRGNVRNDFERRQGRGTLVMRILASEAGYLRRLDVAEGKRVKVGNQLAIVTTEATEPALDDASAPTMRVVATTGDMMESSS